jgi:hypothetical protein
MGEVGCPTPLWYQPTRIGQSMSESKEADRLRREKRRRQLDREKEN